MTIAAVRQRSWSMARNGFVAALFAPARKRATTRPLRAPVFLLAVAAAALLGIPSVAGAPPLERLVVPRDLKVVSYFPADAGWTKMWTNWRPDRVDTDLARVALLHANTVRAIVQPNLFGYPDPQPQYTARLDTFIALAAAHGLHVQLTLFDWWYRWEDIAGSTRWARELLSPYANDPRIAFVELHNEVLPKPQVARWVRTMIPFVRRVLGGSTPVTVSVAGRDPAARLARLAHELRNRRPDFWDVHEFGGGGELMYASLRGAAAAAAPLPLWLGETGYPTTTASTGYGGVPLTDSAQEAAQMHFLATAAWAARAAGLPPIGIWALDDFVPAAVPDRTVAPFDPELHFGLFHVDGTAKPAAELVRALFARGTPPVSFNGGFEAAVTSPSGTNVPAQWSMNGNAKFAEDSTTKKDGAASARVTLGRPGETASLSITPPNAGAQRGLRVVARAWATRRASSSAVVLVIDWLDTRNRVVGRSVSRPLGGAVRAWRQLKVAARAPRRAAYARIDLVVRGGSAPVWFDGVSFTR
jgi:hypothetical protein